MLSISRQSSFDKTARGNTMSIDVRSTKSVRDTGKDISNALNKIASERNLIGRAKNEYVLNGLKGAMEGIKLSSSPDKALLAHIELMHDALSEAMGPKQRRVSRKLNDMAQLGEQAA